MYTAGAFSGHLINSFYTANRSLFHSTETQSDHQISVHGPMSFNPQMHGSFSSNHTSMDFPSTVFDMSQETAIKIATMQAKLDKKLGPEYISQRPGPSGSKLTYAEGWKVAGSICLFRIACRSHYSPGNQFGQ
jgi:DNA repair and recombination protein RAD52